MHKLTARNVQYFWSLVPTDAKGCWEWKGYRNMARGGYGAFGWYRAHRLMYEFTHGPIPAGMVVCHTCDNPPCVRPDHLFLGTRQQNTDDSVHKQRHTHGMTHPMVKLTDAQVQAIRRAPQGRQSRIALSREYGVSQVNIWRIQSGKTWRHIA